MQRERKYDPRNFFLSGLSFVEKSKGDRRECHSDKPFLKNPQGQGEIPRRLILKNPECADHDQNDRR